MNGILPLWKEKGMTSHDCVNAVRRIFQMKRVGHGGTLDPEVDGMLIIAVGSATRVLEFLLEGDKTYQGQITLGQSTTTEDATGEIVKECPVAADLTEKQVDEGLAQFHGTVLQTPPLYSAVHVQGKKLYEYAHQGLKVERPQREVTIYEFVRTSSLQRTTAQKVKFDFKVRCSKGTYVRTLAVDLGRALSYPAHMSALTRTETSSMSREQAVTLDQLERCIQAQGLAAAEKYLLPIEVALPQFEQIALDAETFQKVIHGALLPVDYFNNQNFPLLLTYQDKAIALYKQHPNKSKLMKPWKVLRQEVN